MKRLTCIAVVMISFCNFLYAQQASDINGLLETSALKTIVLYRIDDGKPIQIASSEPDEQQRFAFKFWPKEEALYAIGSANPSKLNAIYKVYFKPGDHLNLAIQEDGYRLLGKNTRENEQLYQLYQAMYPLKEKSLNVKSMSTYNDFFPALQQFLDREGEIRRWPKTDNKKFNAMFPLIMDYDLAFISLHYMFSARTVHPSKEEMIPYYSQMDYGKLLGPDILKFPYGERFMNMLVMQQSLDGKHNTLSDRLVLIADSKVKGEFLAGQLNSLRSYAEYEKVMEAYQDLLVTNSQKERAAAVALKLVDTKGGSAAINFSFADVNGNRTTLRDLKGKVVLLDLWATWCIPCKQEEPYWDKLNEWYAGKDVAFVGISVDKDKAAWEKHLKEKQLKGIQLHAGPGNNISLAYKVNGIPRYILIDKKGNLIADDGPRPSNENLKKLLDTWLAK
jgi:thiol-disulfide isomerase/thioredoxin